MDVSFIDGTFACTDTECESKFPRKARTCKPKRCPRTCRMETLGRDGMKNPSRESLFCYRCLLCAGSRRSSKVERKFLQLKAILAALRTLLYPPHPPDRIHISLLDIRVEFLTENGDLPLMIPDDSLLYLEVRVFGNLWRVT